MTDWRETYLRTHNAELRAAQAEPVQKVLKDILETIKSIERNVHWALEDDRDYCLEFAIERAHSLVDLAHAYRQALKELHAMMNFYWYHSNGDGTADRFEDSPAICARVDSGEPGWFSTPEGAIRHGGVVATAFTLKTEKYMNAARWLETNGRERVIVGERVILTVTEPRA